MPFYSWLNWQAKNAGTTLEEFESKLSVRPIYERVNTKINIKFDDLVINQVLEPYDVVTDLSISNDRERFLGISVYRLIQGTGIIYKNSR